MLQNLNDYFRIFIAFVSYVAKKFHQQRCLDVANSLSYTSLLSIVPLIAVIFIGLSSSPVFQEMVIELEDFIFSNFIPTSSQLIREYIMSFVSKTSGLTAVGIISLIIIALLLMWKIDQVLNNIWEVTTKRNYLKTFLTYWALLTLGPIFIGFSLMATSYLTSLPIINETVQYIGIKKYLLYSASILFTFIAFSFTYLIVPNTNVNIKHALLGGLLATLLFELSKQGFAFYVSSNKTYQNIYGALSTIPIFLIWIYISWLVTLIGAITARSLDTFVFSSNFLSLKSNAKNKSNQTLFVDQNKLIIACYILYFLWQNSLHGKGLSEQQLALKIKLFRGEKLGSIMSCLSKTLWIHCDEKGYWYLSRDISCLTFNTLYNDLPFELPKNSPDLFLKEIFQPLAKANQKLLNSNIKTNFEHYQQELLNV